MINCRAAIRECDRVSSSPWQKPTGCENTEVSVRQRHGEQRKLACFLCASDNRARVLCDLAGRAEFHHDGMDSSRFRCDMIAASADTHQRNQEETEMDATTVAVDLAKSVFELALANAHWRITARHRFTRTQFARFLAATPATHLVMEACGRRTIGDGLRSSMATG